MNTADIKNFHFSNKIDKKDPNKRDIVTARFSV